jgi:hypothetical protein
LCVGRSMCQRLTCCYRDSILSRRCSRPRGLVDSYPPTILPPDALRRMSVTVGAVFSNQITLAHWSLGLLVPCLTSASSTPWARTRSHLATRISGPGLTRDVTRYLVRHNLYELLSQSMLAIVRSLSSLVVFVVNSLFQAMEAQNTPAIPHLIPPVTAPSSNLLPASSPLYLKAFSSLVTSILPIPLLPNRLPISSLTERSSKLYLASFSVLAPVVPALASTLATEPTIPVIENLVAFTPLTRYPKLPPAPLDAYLRLLTTLINSLPINTLNPPRTNSPKPEATAWTNESGS